MSKTALIVVVAVIVVEIINFILSLGKRKMVSYTIMTLLNDLAVLSQKAGYKSWIKYLDNTYGEEKALTFINQIYATLEKNKIWDKRFDEVKKKMKEYLILENKK